MTSSAPATPPAVGDGSDRFHTVAQDDLDVLDQVTAPDFNTSKFRRRDAHFDPLIFAAAACAGSENTTRHHYLHYDVCAEHGRLNCTETKSCEDGAGKEQTPAPVPAAEEPKPVSEAQVKIEGPVSSSFISL